MKKIKVPCTSVFVKDWFSKDKPLRRKKKKRWHWDQGPGIWKLCADGFFWRNPVRFGIHWAVTLAILKY